MSNNNNKNNRIDRILTRINLSKGSHESGNELCIMEAEAFIAGEEHTDRPQCVSSCIGNVARFVNDWMTDEERNLHLAPLLGQFAGTVGNEIDEDQRALIIIRVSITQILPACLVEDTSKIKDLLINSWADVKKAQRIVESMKCIEYMKYMKHIESMKYMKCIEYMEHMEHMERNRPLLCSIFVSLLQELITVKSSTPKEWARDPQTLPCLV